MLARKLRKIFCSASKVCVRNFHIKPHPNLNNQDRSFNPATGKVSAKPRYTSWREILDRTEQLMLFSVPKFVVDFG
jgi:hypothetical protein